MVTRQTLENLFPHTVSLIIRMKLKLISLIMGPGCDTEAQSQAKANYLISLAGQRTGLHGYVVGPHRANVVNITNTETQTTNLINYFSPIGNLLHTLYLILVISIPLIVSITSSVIFHVTQMLLE